MTALKLAVLLLVLLLSGACVGVHAHRRYAGDYHHPHELACDHVVACHFYGGRHHYAGHGSHTKYTHLHRDRGGHYQDCAVVRGRHSYY